MTPASSPCRKIEQRDCVDHLEGVMRDADHHTKRRICRKGFIHGGAHISLPRCRSIASKTGDPSGGVCDDNTPRNSKEWSRNRELGELGIADRLLAPEKFPVRGKSHQGTARSDGKYPPRRVGPQP